ncbi:MAG: phosphatidylserine/phosphatidylglycerophosphate/cardiolipin synthase family protein [Phormidesmis sp.]
MSWWLVTLLVVLFGALLLAAVFLLSLYIRGAFRWRPLLRVEQAIAPTDPRFALTLKSLAGSMSTTGRVIEFWGRAPDIQNARIAAIESAQHSIQFETFIMTPGKRAQDFAAALARKASEGVNVQVMVDSWGTRSLSKKYWQRLKLAGVRIVFFNPFDWRAPANYSGRTHRKLLIIDGKRVLIGGAGISDLWDGVEKGDDEKPWLDVEAALEGEVVLVLASLFQSHWAGHRLTSGSVASLDMSEIYPVPSSPDQRQLTEEVTEEALNRQFSDRTTSRELGGAKQKTATIIVTPGAKPSYRNSPIETVKELLIACARERIWLSSPYFLPNNDTRHLLIAAKEAGVDVRILTTSRKSDKKPVYYASYEVYGSLLRAGVQIFEYQPSMIHAKMLIIDNAWVNTGSANLDYRSFLHNDELDIVTDSEKLIGDIEQVFERGFANSEQIGLKQWKQRSLLKHRVLGNAVRLVQWQL